MPERVQKRASLMRRVSEIIQGMKFSYLDFRRYVPTFTEVSAILYIM
jgi:hypothetical protein